MKKYFVLLMALLLIVPSLALAAASPETLTGTRAASNFPVAGPGPGGSLKTAFGTYDITAAVVDGDIFKLCKIPAGAIVVGGRFYAGDIDATAGEALDMDVGWAYNGSDSADPDGLLNAGTLTGDAVTGVKPETGTSMPLGGVLITSGYKQFARETTIQVEVNTAATLFAAGTIGVVVHYMIGE